MYKIGRCTHCIKKDLIVFLMQYNDNVEEHLCGPCVDTILGRRDAVRDGRVLAWREYKKFYYEELATYIEKGAVNTEDLFDPNPLIREEAEAWIKINGEI